MGKFARIETDNSIPLRSEPLVAFGVTQDSIWLEMMFTVDFNDKLRLVDCEVRDVAAYRHLPTHMNTVESTKLAKLRPKLALAIRHTAPQASGAANSGRVDTRR